MKKIPKIVYLALAVLIALGGVAINGIDRVRAVEPGVYLIDGNASCATLNANTADVYAGITSNFGFKIDSYIDNFTVPTGNLAFTLTQGNQNGYPTVLTGGAPSDPSNTITLTGNTEYLFNWAASLGIDAVIVKASNSSEAYVYIPEATDGGPLMSVQKPDGSYYEISHIEFCYDYELTATKTAAASYTRTYTWDITKEANGDYDGFIGDPAFDHPYTVSVDRIETDSEWAVSGEIVVSNPTPWTVDFSVTDMVGDTAATVNCGGVTSLAPGASVTCTYSAGLAGPVNGTNIATVTSSTSPVGGATTLPAAYTFGDPTTVAGYPMVNVTDSFQGALGSASGDFTFPSYSKSFQCSTNQADYVDGVYVMDQFVNTATIDETGQSDSATVDLTCYAPVVSKDADTEWFKEYTWDITKTANPTSHIGFIGDTFTSDYDIVVDQTITPYGYRAFGSISVTNPVGAPGSITVAVADSVNGTPATLACLGTLTVAPGTTGTCGYTVDLPNTDSRVNTASVTFNTIPFLATADVIFGDPGIVGYPTINVTDTFPYPGGSPEALGSASGDFTFDNDQDFECSSNPDDYINGSYSYTKANRAQITETGDYADEDVTVTCYIPSISKTAAGTYDERHEWDVEKTVSPISQSAFIGQTVDYEWTVTVTEEVFEENFGVGGSITVVNPNPQAALVVTLSDVLDDGTAGVIGTCEGGTFAAGTLTVPAGGTAVCSYSAGPSDDSAENNTASFTLNGVLFAASDPIEWSANVINPSVSLDDNQNPAFPLVLTEGGTWNYSEQYTCSTDKSLYVNNAGTSYTFAEDNLAQIKDGETLLDEDLASTAVVCYIPKVTKDAQGNYKERHDWTVDKSVNPTDQSGYPGDVLGWDWTVTVDETIVELDFIVTGNIYVQNPNPVEDLFVYIDDQLKDLTPVTITGCTDGTYSSTPPASLTIPAGKTAVCGYVAYPKDRDVNTNIVTVKLILPQSLVVFQAEAIFTWIPTQILPEVTLDDDQNSLWPILISDGGTWTYAGTGHTCSSAAAAYYTGGVYTGYTGSEYNKAVLKDGDIVIDEDDATTNYRCDAGFMDLLKLTNGLQDPAMVWNFALYNGPDGFDAFPTPIATDSTPPALLDFGMPALNPEKTYTVCELGMAAGWTSKWNVSLDGGLNYAGIVPYDPNEDDAVPEDIGNRCVDFGAGTTIPVTVGTTINFQVDNTYPGGAPRTPGYWKNWNMCTGGGQAATAAGNGGYEAGFWLLEDVLDPEVGGGIVWDDILGDEFVFTIDRCQLAVSVLDTRDLSTGKQAASNPGYNLAKHLLAYQLNQGAGACRPTQDVYSDMTVAEVAIAAETLLDSYNFGKPGFAFPKKGADANLALTYAGILDQYNNGYFCPDAEESH